MKKYSETELSNVQTYLLLKGHACPSIDGEVVHYLDRTKGYHRVVRTLTIASVLEEIRTLKVVPVEHYVDKSAFVNSSSRYAIGEYQAMEIKGKLIYREDLSIRMKGLFEA